jgi:hypothetical protein
MRSSFRLSLANPTLALALAKRCYAKAGCHAIVEASEGLGTKIGVHRQNKSGAPDIRRA